MRSLLTLISFLLLATPTLAQPKNADLDGNGCVTRDEIVTFYTEVIPEVQATVKYEDGKLLILTSPTRPTDLHITIGPDGCLLPIATEVEKKSEINV